MTAVAGDASLSDQAYQRLARAIGRCELRPGTMLIERDASAELGMSRTPFREAMHRLEQEGLIHTIPRRGGQVTLLDLDDIRDNLEVRRALEVTCVERAMSDGLAFDRQRLDEFIREMRAAERDGDPGSFLEADEGFHFTIVAAARNRRALDAVKTAWIHINRARYLEPPNKADMRRSIRQHRAILSALLDGDAAAVQHAMTSHTSSAEELFRDLMRRMPEAFTHERSSLA
jgi:DNA-binding GntR family transcriptional regulator